MQKKALKAVARVLLPPLLGAAGALAATVAPAYYAAVCGGSVLGI